MRVIEITTFLGLGSLASTLSGLGHQQVAFPRITVPLLLTTPFLAHHSRSSIQDTHLQGTRIVLNPHLTPSPGLIRSEVHKIVDFSLNKKRWEDLILCAAVETLIRVMGFQHWMTSQILLALQRHLGHHWTVKLQEETRTLLGLPGHLGHHGTVKLQEETQTLSGLQHHLGHHWTAKLREETQMLLGLLHLVHHWRVKLQDETQTPLGLQGLLSCQRRVRLQEETLIIGVHFSWVIVPLRFCVCYSPFQAVLMLRTDDGGLTIVFYVLKSLSLYCIFCISYCVCLPLFLDSYSLACWMTYVFFSEIFLVLLKRRPIVFSLSLLHI